MLVTPEVVRFPEVSRRDQVRQYLGRLAEGEFPGFIVQGDPRGSGQDAVELIGELTHEVGGLFDIGSASFGKESGWHVDIRPGETKAGKLKFITHYTEPWGRVKAQLLQPKPAYWYEPFELQDISRIPPHLKDALQQGKVDDRLVVPKMYIGETGGSKVLAFVTSGVKSALHNIVHASPARRSTSYLSWLPAPVSSTSL